MPEAKNGATQVANGGKLVCSIDKLCHKMMTCLKYTSASYSVASSE